MFWNLILTAGAVRRWRPQGLQPLYLDSRNLRLDLLKKCL
jgi:hypothetical protein